MRTGYLRSWNKRKPSVPEAPKIITSATVFRAHNEELSVNIHAPIHTIMHCAGFRSLPFYIGVLWERKTCDAGGPWSRNGFEWSLERYGFKISRGKHDEGNGEPALVE